MRIASSVSAPSNVEHGGFDSMLVGNFSNREKRVVREALLALGADNAERLRQANVTVRLRDPYESEVETHTALYLPEKKQVVLSSSRVSKDTVVHEFGHALDDLAAPDLESKAVLRSEVDGEIQTLYRDYCSRVQELSWWKRLTAQGQWSDYAKTNTQEYLAEGVRKYSSSSGRDHLLRDDPQLCRYLERFLHPQEASVFVSA